jgi:hypothetical protein
MSVEEAELVGFDGDAAVIEGGVPMHVYEKAKEQRKQFKQEHPDADVPDLEKFVSDALGGS